MVSIEILNISRINIELTRFLFDPKEKEWEACGSPRRRGPGAVGGGEAVYGPQASGAHLSLLGQPGAGGTRWLIYCHAGGHFHLEGKMS